MGACALVLLVTPAAAHSLAPAKGAHEAKLRHYLKSLKHDRQVVRFFDKHRWLLSDPRFATEAKRQLSTHRAHLALTMRRLTATRTTSERLEKARRLALVDARRPRAVICSVFGRYCRQALAVARCESKLKTQAENGQYLGLFQMGSSERQLYGHGSGIEAQVRAAHRYFVRSGRDWSPWSCKPW